MSGGLLERGGGGAQGAFPGLELGAEGSWSGFQVSWHRGGCRLEQVTGEIHLVYQPQGSAFCDLWKFLCPKITSHFGSGSMFC
ncbi:hypothetical protein NQZ68_000731 [Dissostichus eleginoides]|nr:hypothetical protein NQZ68_000731 [Dissostichus eleginoides]